MGFASIYISEFPTLAWLRLDASARSCAAAVVEGSAPLERVVSFNQAAKTLGLEHGMSKVQADTSGQVLFHARSIAEEQGALQTVFEIAQDYSPRVQIVASPVNRYGDAKHLAALFLLEQAGTERLYGPARSYAGKLHNALRELRFPSNVAVAPNAEASLLLSRSYTGVTCVDRGGVEAKLAPLPLPVLRCEAETLATLARWGIRNLRELSSLPEAALVSRIGQQGKRLQRMAVGAEDRLFIPQEPAFDLSDHVSLDTPLDSLDSLLFIVSPMLERLLKQAINHAYALRSVRLTLELEKCVPHVLEIRPAVPAQSRDLLLKLLNLKLQAKPPQAEILGVALSAVPAVPQVSQRGLFQVQFPEPGKLDLLLARLKSIAGESHVGSPVIPNSHRDDEFSMDAFQPSAGKSERRSQRKTVRSALRRFRPLQPAKVILRGTEPAVLFWKGERLELGVVAGPWQSSGYWWDGRCWEANEWDAVVARPLQALRLRHESGAGTWYVAGQYD